MASLQLTWTTDDLHITATVTERKADLIAEAPTTGTSTSGLSGDVTTLSEALLGTWTCTDTQCSYY